MASLCSHCGGFEADDEPITCALLEGGPCSPCKARAAIRNQIQHLEAEIAKLKAKYYSLTTPMNANHDPFIHKLPPEIGSHIFRLVQDQSTLIHGGRLEAILNPWGHRLGDLRKILRLGGVCRMWRQLAWATPDLWDTLCLGTGSWKSSLTRWLPNLVREWLERSRSLPLTIFFHGDSDDDNAVEVTMRLVVELLRSHSRRWRTLSLSTTSQIFRHFFDSIQPNQLVGLGFQRFYERSDAFQLPVILMESECAPTHLALEVPLTSMNVRWDKITHLTLLYSSTEECIEALRQAPSLEYCNMSIYSPCKVDLRMPICHPRLRSLHLSTTQDIENFLGVLILPSIEEWIHESIHKGQLPVAGLLSVFKRSGCCLKVLHLKNLLLHSEGLHTLLQAIPTLEHITLCFRPRVRVNTMMDSILARICNSNTLEEPTGESFLPRLQFMECIPARGLSLFSWNRLPQLCRQGRRRSLVLHTIVERPDISDETAVRLLQLADEGLDFQIFDMSISECFLQNFRRRMQGQNV